MPHSVLARVLRQLRRVPAQRGAETLTDGQLLERFASARDEAAFAALLDRHGRMVWNVCRRVLVNTTDADDAFQATFLVLVKKASAIAKQDSVGSWLHGVAYRIALKVRSATKPSTPPSAEPAAPNTDPLEAMSGRELLMALDEELQRLPAPYRVPLVLCYLEGNTRDEAARQLGWSLAMLGRRLEVGRQRLRLRLSRRGVTLPLALFTVALEQSVCSATIRPALFTATLELALGFLPGKGTPPAVPRNVAALTCTP